MLTISSHANSMASLNKIPPVQMTSLPVQPSHFFITPNYSLTGTDNQTISGIPWPTVIPTATLRPSTIPCYPPTDIFFNGGQCILPVNRTSINNDKPPPPITTNDAVLIDDKAKGSNKRKHHHSDEGTPIKIKKESNKTLCDLRNHLGTTNDVRETKLSYPVSALIDIPGSLSKGSRTSSVSSSLSTVRFGGSLSQLWAASLTSLSGKLSSMKSTGNIHAEQPLPSLGNQYFAFGGSLPELSLTSLTRLLPNSSTSSLTSTTITTSPPSTNLLTVLQPPLYVYPSQSHLATPFINANGSISFGSFLSNGSSLCSIHKHDSSDTKQLPHSPSTSPIIVTSSTSSHSNTLITGCHGNTPGNLNTLAHVASSQKNLETERYRFGTIPEATSPTETVVSPISGIDCRSLSPLSDQRIKMEDDDDHSNIGTYSEVKPYFMMMSPLNGSVPCKKEGKDKPYKCDYPGCGRSFSFPAHLKSHVQQIHISYRPCKCDFPGCGKRFYTPQHLNVHKRIHTGERPFVCPYADCNKAFTTAGNLKNHIRTHTGERPYACKFEGCTKRFAEMSSLKKHELTHTGEKPYKCRVCGKAFSQAGSRNTHERKHNRSENDTKVSRRFRIKKVLIDDDTT